MDFGMFTDYIKQLQKAVECSICLDGLVDPVETRCGHTFCSKCLHTALNKKSVLPCPLCKHVIKKRSIKNAAYLSKVVISIQKLKQACSSNFHLKDSSDFSQLKAKLQHDSPKPEGNSQGLDLLDFVDGINHPKVCLVGTHQIEEKCKQPVKSSNNDLTRNVKTANVSSGKCEKNENILPKRSEKKLCNFRRAAKKSRKSVNFSDQICTKDRSSEKEVLRSETDENANSKKSFSIQEEIQPIELDQDNSANTSHNTLGLKKTKLPSRRNSTRASKRNQLLAKGKKESPKKSKLLESDSGKDGQLLQTDTKDDEHHQGVTDKVSSWLENVLPVAHPDTENEENENDDFQDSDMDDLVSASQQHAPYGLSKRKRMVSDAILRNLKMKSVNRDDEIFGGKSKQQYCPKTFAKDLHYFGKANPSVKQSRNSPLQQEKKLKRSKRKTAEKRSRKKNIFDINGLSQGVSPFSSPSKIDTENSETTQDSPCQSKNIDSMETHVDSACLLNVDFAENESPKSSLSKSTVASIAVVDDEAVALPDAKRDLVSDNDLVKESPSPNQDLKGDSFPTASGGCRENTPEDKRFVSANTTPDSQSTISTIESSHNVTTVTATVHTQSKQFARKNEASTAFKTPVNLPSASKLRSGRKVASPCLLRLEDMPIVCVAETQDDSDALKPYYVETPAHSKSVVLPVKARRETDTSLNDPTLDEIQSKQVSSPPPDIDDDDDEVKNDRAPSTEAVPPPETVRHSSIPDEPRKKDEILDITALPASSPDKESLSDCRPSLSSSLCTNVIENTEEIGDPLAAIRPNRIRTKRRSPALKESASTSSSLTRCGEVEARGIQPVVVEESMDTCNDAAVEVANDGEEVYFSAAETSQDLRDPRLEAVGGEPTTPGCHGADKSRASSTWPLSTSSSRDQLARNRTNAIERSELASQKRKLGSRRNEMSDAAMQQPELDPASHDESISSSPLLFAPSQSQAKNPSKLSKGLCESCSKRSMVDKMVQCQDDDLTLNVQPSQGFQELIDKLKTLCETIHTDPSILHKIGELEKLVGLGASPASSNHSPMKPSTRRKTQMLATLSDDDSVASPLKRNERVLGSSQSDDDDFEIENSLPELTAKRSLLKRGVPVGTKRKCFDVNSKSGTNLDEFDDVSAEVADDWLKRSTMTASGNSTESDVVILATSRSNCRKRVLSLSSEDDGCHEEQLNKRSREDNAIPLDGVYESSLPSRDDLDQSYTGAEVFNRAAGKQTEAHTEHDDVESFNSPKKTGSSLLHVDETPPLTDSQVPPPTPPPAEPPGGTSEETPGIQAILKRHGSVTNDLAIISDLTNSGKNHEADKQCFDVLSSDEEQNKQDENSQTGLKRLSTDVIITINSSKPDSELLRDKTNSEVATSPNPVGLSDLSISDSSYSCGSRKFGIMVSGLRGKAVGLVRLFAKKWGGEFFESFVAGKVTHAVVRTQNMRCDRTLKYLQAVASKSWVVSISWITQSLKMKKLLPEDRFEVIGDNLETSDELAFSPKRSRLSPADFKLLSEYAIYCIPPFALFTEAQFVELLRLCGAKVLSQVEDFAGCHYPSGKRIITVDPDAYTEELPNSSELAVKYDAEVVSCSWALDCIGTLNLQPTSNFPIEDLDSEMLSCE